MAEAIGWKKVFTSNALRHGFASQLNQANVDMKIIQESSGHETQGQSRCIWMILRTVSLPTQSIQPWRQ
ncbi:tyrosine-type recombinase/integrase [Mucilaginibacter sp. SG538B]|uniref:tyrosine-type recombinase/integrase n=1 Tax=Mucilaginibacter sp. SG538B TaxID=2587021 RepID=UPI00159E2F0F